MFKPKKIFGLFKKKKKGSKQGRPLSPVEGKSYIKNQLVLVKLEKKVKEIEKKIEIENSLIEDLFRREEDERAEHHSQAKLKLEEILSDLKEEIQSVRSYPLIYNPDESPTKLFSDRSKLISGGLKEDYHETDIFADELKITEEEEKKKDIEENEIEVVKEDEKTEEGKAPKLRIIVDDNDSDSQNDEEPEPLDQEEIQEQIENVNEEIDAFHESGDHDVSTIL